jgi:hypothetical protein
MKLTKALGEAEVRTEDRRERQRPRTGASAEASNDHD